MLSHIFANVPLFEGLEPDELAEIERQANTKRYRKSTVVIEKGDEFHALYVLVSGRAKVFVSDDAGKEIVLSELGPGDHFGELALLGGFPRTASVITLTDCEMRLLTGGVFRQVLARHPEMALRIIGQLSLKVAVLTERVSDLALLSVYARVAKVLSEEVIEDGGRQVTRALTQQSIADRVGCSREMVSRILTDLKTGGYVSIEGKRFVLHRRLPERWQAMRKRGSAPVPRPREQVTIPDGNTIFMPIAVIVLAAGITGTSVTLTRQPSSAPEPRTAAVSAPAHERADKPGVFLAAND